MGRGTWTWKDPKSGVEILGSNQADKILTVNKKGAFLTALAAFMVEIGADRAYVSKQGRGLAVSLIWSCKEYDKFPPRPG